MAKGKEVPIAIVIRANDQASAKIQATVARLNASIKAMAPGFAKVGAGIRGIGSELAGAARAAGILGGAVAAAIYGVKHLGDEFDDLGDAAEKVGVTADALAQLRYAAKISGSSVEELDAGMSTFVKGLGQAQAGTGKLAGFLKRVSPELLKQVKGAKSSEEAFGIMADAVNKLEDPTKRAALATAAFGGAGVGLAPLLSKGSKGIGELRAHYFKLAGSQQGAVDEAGRMEAAFGDLDLATTRLKGSIVRDLGPAIVKLSKAATDFLVGHQAEIGAFIRDFGEKLPGVFESVGAAIRGVGDVVRPVIEVLGDAVDTVGGAENAVKLLVASWVAFKALKIAGHIAGITSGLVSMGKAAAGASAAGAAGGAAAGKGGRLGGLITSLPLIGAGAMYTADTIADDQERGMAAADRGRGLWGDLKRFRERGTLGSRHMLAETLGKGGFLDKSGKFVDTIANRQALTSGMTFRGPADLPSKRLPGLIRELEEAARTDRTERTAASALRGNVGAGVGAGAAPISREEFGQLIAALQKLAGGAVVQLDIKGAPPGSRVEAKKGREVIDLAVGYLMGTP